MNTSSNENDKKPKKSSRVAEIFEDWSRPLGLIGLVSLSYAQIFLEVEVNAIAWFSAGMLLAGRHTKDVAEVMVDKINELKR